MRERAVFIRTEERGRRAENRIECVSILAEREGNGKREKRRGKRVRMEGDYYDRSSAKHNSYELPRHHHDRTR